MGRSALDTSGTGFPAVHFTECDPPNNKFCSVCYLAHHATKLSQEELPLRTKKDFTTALTLHRENANLSEKENIPPETNHVEAQSTQSHVDQEEGQHDVLQSSAA